jgi:hypothetical protein
LKCLDYNEDSVCDTLSEQWAISLADAVDQTLTFDYGVGDGAFAYGYGDGPSPTIEFYAAADTGGSDITLNCYSNLADLQGPVDPSNPNGGIDGFVITSATSTVPANFPTVRRDVLDFTFTSNIVNFAGFDGTDALNPTVEFCVKVTLGGVQYKELALKYAINLNGGIGAPDAFLVDAEEAADTQTSGATNVFLVDAEEAADTQTSVIYTTTAYVCDESGIESASDVTVTQGNTIYICLESDSLEAPVTGIQDLFLSTDNAVQVLYNANSVQRLTRSVNDCAGGKCIVEFLPGVDFFEALSATATNDVVISGDALLELGSLGSTRNLLTSKANPHRALQLPQKQIGAVSGGFVAIAGDDQSGAAPNGVASLTMLVIMAAAALALLYLIGSRSLVLML